MIKLGTVARDKVSGFTGKVVARTEYLYCTPQCTLKPQSLHEDGKLRDAGIFEEDQLTEVMDMNEKELRKHIL